MTESIGFIGGILLGLCGLPEAYYALTTGVTGLSWPFLLSWYLGEVFLLIYTLIKSKEVKLWPLILNYGANLVFISIIIMVKLGVL